MTQATTAPDHGTIAGAHSLARRARRFDDLAHGLLATISETLAICARHRGAHVFDITAKQARNYRTRLRLAMRSPALYGPCGTDGTWGKNGYAPAIKGLLTSAKTFERFVSDAVPDRIAA